MLWLHCALGTISIRNWGSGMMRLGRSYLFAGVYSYSEKCVPMALKPINLGSGCSEKIIREIVCVSDRRMCSKGEKDSK